MKSFVLKFFIAARFANASQFHCLSTNSPATSINRLGSALSEFTRGTVPTGAALRRGQVRGVLSASRGEDAGGLNLEFLVNSNECCSLILFLRHGINQARPCRRRTLLPIRLGFLSPFPAD